MNNFCSKCYLADRLGRWVQSGVHSKIKEMRSTIWQSWSLGSLTKIRRILVSKFPGLAPFHCTLWNLVPFSLFWFVCNGEDLESFDLWSVFSACKRVCLPSLSHYSPCVSQKPILKILWIFQNSMGFITVCTSTGKLAFERLLGSHPFLCTSLMEKCQRKCLELQRWKPLHSW